MANGRTPTTNDWLHADPDGAWPAATGIYFGRGPYRNQSGVFATWNDALRAAGLPLNQRQTTWTRWTRESLIEEIARHSVDGVAPSPKTIGPLYHRLSTSSRTHFGSWRAACEAGGVTPRGKARS